MQPEIRNIIQQLEEAANAAEPAKAGDIVDVLAGTLDDPALFRLAE